MQKVYRYIESSVAVAAIAVIAFTCIATLVNIPFGTDHPNIIKAFDGDEYYGVMIMKRNLQNNVIDPQPFYVHGRVYQSLTFWTIKALAALGYVQSDRLIIIVFRTISFVMFVLVLTSIYLIMRRLQQSLLSSIFSVLLIASLPEVNHYAQIFHPDMLHMFLIVLAFAFAIWRHSFLNAFIASGIYGLAIAAKLGTPLLFPFLLLPASLQHISSARPPFSLRNEAMFLTARSLMAFLFLVGCFLFAYPHALTKPFLDDLSLISSIVSTGVWIGGQTVVPMPANPLLWFPVLSDEFSVAGLVLVCAGIGLLLLDLYRGTGRAPSMKDRFLKIAAADGARTLFTAAAYVVVALGLMVLLVRTRNSRYLFPIYPFVAIACFSGIDAMLRKAKRPWLNIVIQFIILAVLASHALTTVRTWSVMANKYSSPRVAASQWIMQNYGTKVVVVTDAGTYVPPEMPNFIMDEHQIARRLPLIEHNPEVRLIIVTRVGSKTWAWMKEGTTLRDGQIEAHPEFGAEDAHNFARFLRDVAKGGSAWKLVLEYDELLVMENTKARK